jgi:hypothetical protein
LADAKKTTVGELTGARRRYSKIQVPEKLHDFVGQSEIIIEHIDEGFSMNELPYWSAFWQIKADEEKRRKGR